MQADEPTDLNASGTFSRLRRQIMELVASSAGQRRALDGLVAKAQALAERIERAGLSPGLKGHTQR
jgi:hypothetical protein